MPHILIVATYYAPESVGAAVWLKQLADDLASHGHRVSVLTSLPSYPEGRVFPAYRGRWHVREQIGSVQVIRAWTHASAGTSFWSRFLSFGSFCASSVVSGAVELVRGRLHPDVVLAILPPLPLGVSAWALARMARARLVVNVQDIHPEIAIATGF